MKCKYIRTKDNKIYIVVQVGETTYMTTKGQYIKRFEITKIADTIEELCDEFVAINIGIFGDKTKSYKTIKEAKEDKTFLYDRLYGAIRTDKGFIYVAKINEEGELELL